jgi:hypothetical protein
MTTLSLSDRLLLARTLVDRLGWQESAAARTESWATGIILRDGARPVIERRRVTAESFETTSSRS